MFSIGCKFLQLLLLAGQTSSRPNFAATTNFDQSNNVKGWLFNYLSFHFCMWSFLAADYQTSVSFMCHNYRSTCHLFSGFLKSYPNIWMLQVCTLPKIVWNQGLWCSIISVNLYSIKKQSNQNPNKFDWSCLVSSSLLHRYNHKKFSLHNQFNQQIPSWVLLWWKSYFVASPDVAGS